MSSFFKNVCGAVALLAASTGYASAAANLDPCSGGDCTLVGYFGGNDKSSGPDKSLTIDGITGLDVDLVKVGGMNSVDRTDIPTNNTPGTIGTFTFTRDSDGKSGTWSTTGDAIVYISVKASNNFALYKYMPAATSGLWSTNGLVNNGGNQPRLSHLTFWTVDVGDREVMEPASLTLLGAGLVLMGLSRRQRKIKS